jgi:hypothetical protein
MRVLRIKRSFAGFLWNNSLAISVSETRLIPKRSTNVPPTNFWTRALINIYRTPRPREGTSSPVTATQDCQCQARLSPTP